MRTRFKTGWRGKLILQIFEQGVHEFYDEDTRKSTFQPWERWRNAKVKDFPNILSVEVGGSL